MFNILFKKNINEILKYDSVGDISNILIIKPTMISMEILKFLQNPIYEKKIQFMQQTNLFSEILIKKSNMEKARSVIILDDSENDKKNESFSKMLSKLILNYCPFLPQTVQIRNQDSYLRFVKEIHTPSWIFTISNCYFKNVIMINSIFNRG